jgi:UDP-N-acetylmuramate dehydrogenase
MLSVLAERRKKFPLRQPNCGSVFTNAPMVYEKAGPPGKVVEETGLKGFRVGGAQVSHRHANFVVNLGGATAADVLALVTEVRRRVYDRIGEWLECEVRYVDEAGTIVPLSTACPRD